MVKFDREGVLQSTALHDVFWNSALGEKAKLDRAAKRLSSTSAAIEEEEAPSVDVWTKIDSRICRRESEFCWSL